MVFIFTKYDISLSSSHLSEQHQKYFLKWSIHHRASKTQFNIGDQILSGKMIDKLVKGSMAQKNWRQTPL